MKYIIFGNRQQATGNRQQRIGVSIQPSAISYQRVAYQLMGYRWCYSRSQKSFVRSPLSEVKLLRFLMQ
ncbi:MAG: hypothetical protein F6K44_09720 [Moorea sp. SIO3E2]|nr:hypothetical protein [Moorena sp. SIO3E2]